MTQVKDITNLTRRQSYKHVSLLMVLIFLLSFDGTQLILYGGHRSPGCALPSTAKPKTAACTPGGLQEERVPPWTEVITLRGLLDRCPLAQSPDLAR